jgi:hypothetical protein
LEYIKSLFVPIVNMGRSREARRSRDLNNGEAAGLVSGSLDVDEVAQEP